MKNKLLTLLILITCAFSQSSYSAMTNFVTITSTKVNSSQAYIFVSGMNDNNNCGNPSFARLYWASENVDRFWSLLLAAQMAGKKVAFDGTCVSSYLSITSIIVKSY